MKCKEKKKNNQLTKASVLRKFVETLDLKLEKISRCRTYWRLVRYHGDVLCHVYAPNSVEIYTISPQTDILDFLLNDIPWWYEIWPEKREDSSGTTNSMRKVEFVNNPVFGCKSLEEAMLKLDLLDSEKPKK